MKHVREEEVSLALSLSTDSGDSPRPSKRARRRPAAASGEGEFVCKTCSRAFQTFQALGGHRTSHMRGRQGLGLGIGIGGEIKAAAAKLKEEKKARQHECHICGLGFEMGQALGGHMRRHRDEVHGGTDKWGWPRIEDLGRKAETLVLLKLFA